MTWLLRGLVILTLAALTLAPGTAEARRGGIILITYGDSIKHLADIPAELQPVIEKASGQSGLKVGFKYSYFGLFWVDLWTWGGQFCLYHDRQFIPVKPEMAAALLKVTSGTPSKPLTYTLPPGLPVVLGLILVGIFMSRASAARGRARMLLGDARYIHVMFLFDEATARTGSPTPTTEVMTAARAVLVEGGIPADEADASLGLLVKHRSHADVQGYWNALKVALAEAALADQAAAGAEAAAGTEAAAEAQASTAA